ncbi:hypothetical protein KL942_004703 [Ogataea angusta]|uniref:BHLH domain-containing protein n=1 Tax=Pichia angusta TaxID=870730 RepID=A0ABQ7RSD0_PICAN|nr:hypothetical protein KL942_004703 [Ogataea angusta]KAG7846477.1 hypothetical protein KL940_004429 [Ogataea angusta]
MELPSLINDSEETENTKPTEPEQGSSLRQESISQELRKHLHIKSEQRRRSKIIDGFQKLRNIIPLVKPQTDSKAQVLKKATEYIEELQYQNSALAANCEMLKEYSHQLHNQLLQLNATPVTPTPQLHRVYSQELGQTQIQYPAYPGVFAPPMGHSQSDGRIMPYPTHLAPPPPPACPASSPQCLFPDGRLAPLPNLSRTQRRKKKAPTLVRKYFRSAFIGAISKFRTLLEHSAHLQARITSLWQGVLQFL